MTKIRVFPHEELCPEGKEIDAESGEILAEVLLQNQIKIEHACELSCACTTCHVIVRKGFESLCEAQMMKRICWIKLGVLNLSQGLVVRWRSRILISMSSFLSTLLIWSRRITNALDRCK